MGKDNKTPLAADAKAPPRKVQQKANKTMLQTQQLLARKGRQVEQAFTVGKPTTRSHPEGKNNPLVNSGPYKDPSEWRPWSARSSDNVLQDSYHRHRLPKAHYKLLHTCAKKVLGDDTSGWPHAMDLFADHVPDERAKEIFRLYITTLRKNDKLFAQLWPKMPDLVGDYLQMVPYWMRSFHSFLRSNSLKRKHEAVEERAGEHQAGGAKQEKTVADRIDLEAVPVDLTHLHGLCELAVAGIIARLQPHCPRLPAAGDKQHELAVALMKRWLERMEQALVFFYNSFMQRLVQIKKRIESDLKQPDSAFRDERIKLQLTMLSVCTCGSGVGIEAFLDA